MMVIARLSQPSTRTYRDGTSNMHFCPSHQLEDGIRRWCWYILFTVIAIKHVRGIWPTATAVNYSRRLGSKERAQLSCSSPGSESGPSPAHGKLCQFLCGVPPRNWHSTVGWPLRGGRNTKIYKNPKNKKVHYASLNVCT